jgi:hypothetical protein
MERDELIEMLLSWKDLQAAADLLADGIREAVLAMGETVTIPGAKAEYYTKPGKTDYEAACQAAGVTQEQLVMVPAKPDYAKTAKALKVDTALYYQPGGADVRLKLEAEG